jgi:lactam utilization protein B
VVFAAIVPANEGAAQALTELVVAGEAAGLEIHQEIHADRGYPETGQLIPRSAVQSRPARQRPQFSTWWRETC